MDEEPRRKRPGAGGGAGALPGMPAPDEIEQRVAALEAVDRRFDVLDGRFDALERNVDDGFRRMEDGFSRIDEEFRKVDNGFIEMRAKFDMTAAGLERIAKMIEQRGDDR